MNLHDTKADDAPAGSTAGTIAYLLFGPILWSLHLTVLYFSQSMLCAHGAAGFTIAGVGIVPFVIVVATAVILVLLCAAMLAPAALGRLMSASGGAQSESSFQRRVMAALAMLSACGVAWAGLASFVLPICAQLR
jgi:hypothetical protein